jgi:hypothetical protein
MTGLVIIFCGFLLGSLGSIVAGIGIAVMSAIALIETLKGK